MANRKHEGASHATPLSPFFRVTVGFNFLLLQIFGVGFFWSVQPWPKSSPVENNEPPTPPTALMAEERSQHGALWEIPPLPPGPAQWVKCFIPAWSLNKQALHKESRWGREAAVPRAGVNAATALRVNHYSSWTGTIPGNAAAVLGEACIPLAGCLIDVRWALRATAGGTRLAMRWLVLPYPPTDGKDGNFWIKVCFGSLVANSAAS